MKRRLQFLNALIFCGASSVVKCMCFHFLGVICWSHRSSYPSLHAHPIFRQQVSKFSAPIPNIYHVKNSSHFRNLIVKCHPFCDDTIERSLWATVSLSLSAPTTNMPYSRALMWVPHLCTFWDRRPPPKIIKGRTACVHCISEAIRCVCTVE